MAKAKLAFEVSSYANVGIPGSQVKSPVGHPTWRVYGSNNAREFFYYDLEIKGERPSSAQVIRALRELKPALRLPSDLSWQKVVDIVRAEGIE